MFKNYIKIAWRRLVKSKLYSSINIIGLTTGITACVLIGLYIMHELSYDKFHTNGDRIVRVTMDYGNAGETHLVATTGTKVGPQLSRTFPVIKDFARLYNITTVVKKDETMFEEKRVVFADSAFFRMFSFPVLQGDAKTLLSNNDNVVLTESIAKKYFGKENAIGKTLLIGSTERPYIVSGIVADVPGNTQIPFDFILPFAGTNAAKSEQWFTANYFTYLLLNKESDIATLQEQVKSYMQTVNANELKMTGSDYLTYHLEPLKSVYLHSSLNGLIPNGSITSVYILTVIALLILLIACINYTNLATAQAAGRSTEIGLRKTFGAIAKQLIAQFLGESMLLAFIALILGVFLAALVLPSFNQLTGKALSVSMLMNPYVWLMLLLITVVTGVAAGAYPALLLSNSRISGMLKSGMKLTSSGGGFRKSLIVFQFVVSVFLIICTLVVTGQLNFIHHKSLGYEKEHTIILPVDGKIRTNYEDFKSAIAGINGVASVSGAYESPAFVQWGDEVSTLKGGAETRVSVRAMPVDLDFIPSMKMQVLSGTNFSRSDLSLLDTSNDGRNYRNTFILNESAAKAFGWTPEEAVGKTIKKGNDGLVKAVVKDFHFSSLHEAITPLILFLNTDFVNELYVKVNGNDMQATLGSLQTVWKSRVPHRPFSYRFLDEDYAVMYANEQRTVNVFTVFSSIAITLACLGLLGLTAYVTVQRTKEIGIRKVLGASSLNITVMIVKNFLLLVVLAIVIASPIAWWAMNTWLSDFAYRIHVSWWMFGVAASIALFIAIATVCAQAVRVSLNNPVKSLRSE